MINIEINVKLLSMIWLLYENVQKQTQLDKDVDEHEDDIHNLLIEKGFGSDEESTYTELSESASDSNDQ